MRTIRQGIEASPRLCARMAGVFYLITIGMGLFAEVGVRGQLVVRHDAAATATNIVGRESWYRSGLAADLIMLAAYIVVTVLLFVLFKPAGAKLSMLAAFFSLTGIAVLAVNCLLHVAPLLLLRHAHHLAAFETAQLHSLALFSLRLHALGYKIAGVFFGPYCIMIGCLIVRSRFLPRFIGVLMALGGLSYLAGSCALFLLPRTAAHLPDPTLLGGIAELALTIWLIVFGVNASKWQEHGVAQVAR
ncbi:MAG TPA: DUF4386 domain-containing protein [Thermoanaerobaculia bacterium]|nr:DUF4386 domain-containing protein [Thermoanaerobaculia bacterium]